MKQHVIVACIAMSLVSSLLCAKPVIHVRSSDRALAQTLQKKMISLAAQTNRSDLALEGGPFGSFFDLARTKYKDPILVSSTDGIGIKCAIAQSIAKHDTIGFDLVANCVNSLVAQGAEPLFFIDYFATGKLNIDEASQLLTGIAAACKKSQCSLIGAETIEMPGVYQKGAYDITGFAVGLVERDCMLPRSELIETGDVLIGLSGTGIHANGFSLLAKIIQEKQIDPKATPPFLSHHTTLAQALLEPSTLYIKSVLPLCKTNTIKAIAHTTDSLFDALESIIPDHLSAHIDLASWQIPPLFRWIKYLCNHNDAVMAHTFNLGIGMALITTAQDAQTIIDAVKKQEVDAHIIGSITHYNSTQRISIGGSIQSHAMRIMVIGNGASEHALAWKIAQSPYVGLVATTPGNGGTSQETKIKNIPLNPAHSNALITYAQQNKIDLVIPGDSCITTDFATACEQKGIRYLGPKKSALALVQSDAAVRTLCEKYAIPYKEQTGAQKIIVTALSDDSTIMPLSSAILYPHMLNGDIGAITSGMGAYSPASGMNSVLEARIAKEIFEPLLAAFHGEQTALTGFLHVAITIDQGVPYLSGFNFGLGDPTAETILMRLKSDLCTLCYAATDHALAHTSLTWDPQTAISTIATYNQHPATVKAGDVIAGAAYNENAQSEKIFHHATASKNNTIVTNGSRVLCASALGKTILEARNTAYGILRGMYWPEIHYRTDIGYGK